jgi:hypothetical protein
VIEERWEHGSDPHWIQPAGRASYSWNDRAVLFGNGRFALNAVLEKACVTRLWVPSFYCPEVIAAIPNKQLEVLTYKDSPDKPLEHVSLPACRPHDAVIVQNLYGLRAGPPQHPDGVVVVEDHTHDPTSAWARRSSADYCFASLRKQLPVGDGGVVWSPKNLSLPAEPELDPTHMLAAIERLTGILLKTSYLDGGAIEKETFRAHLVAGENALAKGPSSTLMPITRALLPAFPVEAWRAQRGRNFAAFSEELGTDGDNVLLRPEPQAIPFIATLVFDTNDARDNVRRELIRSRVYPAVLWPLDSATYAIPEQEIALSRRVLSIHCDHRYSVEEMKRVAAIVRAAICSVASP